MRETEQLLLITERTIADYESALLELDDLERELKEIELELPNISKKLEVYEEARVVLQDIAKETRVAVASDLEHVVTLCLQAVFGEKWSFEIEIDTSRNNTVIEFFVIDNRGPKPVRRSPEDSMGGGTLDTCAIGLRFGLLQILNPTPVGPIILDEPAKQVSSTGGRVEEIATLLQELTDMFQKQTLLVTHHDPIKAIIANSILFENVDGFTKITYVEAGEVA